MAYDEFAYFYDDLNGEADYDTLFQKIHQKLLEHGVQNGIVADLGCGTGDLTLMLTQAGYDMIGVDISEEMLSVLRDKAEQLGLLDRLLLLNQDILSLDLFGTVRAVISTFDTFNHIGPLPRFEQAIRKAAFFLEEGGVFVFDLNTPYKHQEILGQNSFEIETPDALCNWQNHFDDEAQKVDIALKIRYKDTDEVFEEHFSEYSYPLDAVRAVLERYGFALAEVLDGETFAKPQPDSQRYLLTAIKQYTQEEKTAHE